MANKPYPFSVCKECASGGSGGGDIDLSRYVEKVDSYGLATIMNHSELDMSVVGGQITKEWKEIIVKIDGVDNGVLIPAYTSDLKNDRGYVKQTDIDTSIQAAILDSWEAEV